MCCQAEEQVSFGLRTREKQGEGEGGYVHARSAAWDTVANSTHLNSDDSNLPHRIRLAPLFYVGDVGGAPGKNPLQRHEQQIIRILAAARYGTRLRLAAVLDRECNGSNFTLKCRAISAT